MKKLIFITVFLLLAVCLLAACKPSGFDHVWSYNFDNAKHQLVCRACGEEKEKEDHTLDEDGACSVCEITPGVFYSVSEDGKYAEVTRYNGTATKVKLAKKYNGLPVRIIAERAFSGNQTITAVEISKSVTKIGEAAFEGCTNLASVLIPNSVTYIDYAAFTACDSLVSVVIPDSVTTLADVVFWGCKGLTSVVIGDGVKTIGSSVFGSCVNLTSVEIGKSVTVIAEGAFRNCKALESIVIPDGVEKIHPMAFYQCSLLESIVIPESVTSFGHDAFKKCDNLAHVYYCGTREQWLEIKGRNFLSKPEFHFEYDPKK
ncbi:MAG: leucine-rich repeat domain-containing protein [Clostridia bacterium]|nr:leucine-rich repeat domain-containing protein [Clostridia bacterium]